MLSNLSENYHNSEKLAPIGSSDHCCVLWKSKQIIKYKRPKRVHKWIHDYSPANRDNFHRAMNCLDFNGMHKNCHPVNDLSELLLGTLLSVHDTCFPLTKVCFTSDDKPWINSSIRLVVKKRERAHKRGCFVKFQHYRKKVKQMIRTAKAKWSMSLGDLSKKKTWASIKLCGGVNKVPEVADDFDVCELNDYFSSVFSTDCGCFDFDIEELPSIPVSLSRDSIEISLRRLKKNAGPDGIPVWIFSEYASHLSEVVCVLIERSLNDGVFPTCLKKANVTPVAKVKHPRSCSDYRPISLLSPLSKLIEQCAIDAWFKPTCIKEHGFFRDQFAFVPLSGRGTTTALTMLYGKILKHLDIKGTVRLLFVDFSKAFDKALPSTCLRSLATAKMPQQALYWTYNFLTGRSQRTVKSGKFSNWLNVTSGVPQGSKLGPLIFAYLLSSLQPAHNHSCFVKYADDVTCAVFMRDNDDDVIQQELDNICNWSENNGMFINFRKTKHMTLGRGVKVLPVILDNRSGTVFEKWTVLSFWVLHWRAT